VAAPLDAIAPLARMVGLCAAGDESNAWRRSPLVAFPTRSPRSRHGSSSSLR